jgi:hypothetical protein
VKVAFLPAPVQVQVVVQPRLTEPPLTEIPVQTRLEAAAAPTVKVEAPLVVPSVAVRVVEPAL